MILVGSLTDTLECCSSVKEREEKVYREEVFGPT